MSSCSSSPSSSDLRIDGVWRRRSSSGTARSLKGAGEEEEQEDDEILLFDAEDIRGGAHGGDTAAAGIRSDEAEGASSSSNPFPGAPPRHDWSGEGGLYEAEAETEEEVDASLREALRLLLQAPQALEDDDDDEPARTAAFQPRARSQGTKDPPDSSQLHGDTIRWTHCQVGVFRDLWIEKRYDTATHKWKAKVERKQQAAAAAGTMWEEVEAEDDPGTAAVARRGDDEASSADALVREIARLRRKLALVTGDDKSPIEDVATTDVEIGFGHDGDTSQYVGRLDGRPNAQRPGAFRVGGTTDDDDGASESDDERSAGPMLPPPIPSTVPPSTLAARRTDTILLEADLVEEQDGSNVNRSTQGMLVTATPIRRRRQVLALMLLSAAVIGLAVGIAMGVRSSRGPAGPELNSTTVASLQREFNRSLPKATLREIHRGATPQAMAYDWLFNSGYHPDLPAGASVSRLTHRFALATIHYATGGATWKARFGWLDKALHECFWDGIYCPDVHLSEGSSCRAELNLLHSVSTTFPKAVLEGIDLSENGLAGSIPPEIAMLSYLQELKLEYNALDASASLPTHLGMMTRLTSLTVQSVGLQGTIPTELGRLANLTTFIAYLNLLTGPIPTELGNLTSLVELSLNENRLSGTLPPEMGDLVALRSMELHKNQLEGPIPNSFGQLQALTTLKLGENQLTGPIPFTVGNMSSLSELSAPKNNLNGTLPSSIGNFSRLTSLMLNENLLTGPLPSALGGLSSLQNLAAFGNRLNSSIPSSMGDLGQLTSLMLNTNKLQGSIPPELGRLTLLTKLQLNENEFTSKLPTELGQLTRLWSLEVSNNQFLNGDIPTELGDLRLLTGLSLQGTNVSGTIPTELGKLTSLTEELDLVGCTSITGRIPTEIGNLAQLQRVTLYRTAISGSIPSELGQMRNLNTLELHETKLTGTLPSEICDLIKPPKSLNVTIDCAFVNCTCDGCVCVDLPYNRR
jgi:Leucine-rich repeat (LRR) protein